MHDSILAKVSSAALTDFQRAVYRYTAGIPKGQTRTYAQVAVAIGRPKAVRAVGTALKKNPFAPQVPCHRVIRSDGSIGGFAFGSNKKKALLHAEGAL